MGKPRTTTEKGLGHRHQWAVEDLMRRHVDGSPCDWCGKPRWLDPTKNHDYDPEYPNKRGNGVLQGDHSQMTRSEAIRKGVVIPPPDRLLHAECNRSRGTGKLDHLAVANRKAIDTGELKMPWPWQ